MRVEQRAEQQHEDKRTALLAAAQSMAGLSTMRDRDQTILDTADKFLAWLQDDQ